jgi:hypothetical protein
MVFNSAGASALRTSPIDPGARARAARADQPSESAEAAVSFESQLANVIEKYLNQSANGSRIEIQLAHQQGQNPGARPFLVTLLEPGEAPFPPAASPAAPPAQLSPSQMLMYSGTVQYVPAPAAETATPAPTNVYDAYWATQPPEVQELRTIPREAERTLRAQELAREGFAIDVPIMVWQWDPFMTMRARELAGFTWVPSANNNLIELGPGIDFPGLEPYDAAHPPTGSIKVTTEFAKGLENTSIWWRPGLFVDAESTAADPTSKSV